MSQLIIVTHLCLSSTNMSYLRSLLEVYWVEEALWLPVFSLLDRGTGVISICVGSSACVELEWALRDSALSFRAATVWDSAIMVILTALLLLY